MLKVKIRKGENLDKALKTLKFKIKRVKQVQELRERSAYIKPSVKKRTARNKAIYVQKKRNEEENANSY